MARPSCSRTPSRIIWFDAEANLKELSTRQGVREAIEKCWWANADAVIVDVKPLSGLVLCKSDIAPHISARGGYPEGYDLLGTVVEECADAGIQVHAAVNVLSEGSQKLGIGPALDNPEWQCVECAAGPNGALCRVGESSAVHHAVFVNPLNRDVRDYELAIVREICGRYPIDGIVFDRLRYPNLFSDFSELTRREFEARLGRQVDRWPGDVLARGADGEAVWGPLFKDWLRFRAKVIQDFLCEAIQAARSARRDIQAASYVGSWYRIYYDVGVNWGAAGYRPDLDWWPEGYEQTGCADLLDYICTGCYYECVTRAQARAQGLEEWRSVEAAAVESMEAVDGAAQVCAGLYLLQYDGGPELFRQAVRQCLKASQGCMLFDLVYLRNYDWWSIVRDEFGSTV